MENTKGFVTGLLALIFTCLFAFFWILVIFGLFNLKFEGVTVPPGYIQQEDISNYLNYLYAYNLHILIGLNMIGFIVGIIGGALLIHGGYRNKKKASGVGFRVGIAGWGLVILSSIIEIIFNQQHLATAESENLAILIYSCLIVAIQPLYWFWLLWLPAFMNNLLPYQTGLLVSIIYLSTITVATILGSVSFRSTQKEGI